MRFSRILIGIQMLLIALLAAMLVLSENEQNDHVQIPVELCHPARIERIQWKAKIEVKHTDLARATEQIDSDRERVIRNFSAKGLRTEEINFLPIESFSIMGDSTINGFHLIQKIEISSTEVQRVQKIIAESSDLLRFKVQFSAEEPTYELADFRSWLTGLLPVLANEGKAIAASNKDLLKGKEMVIHKLHIKPFFSDLYEQCTTESTAGFPKSDSVFVHVHAYIDFALR
jgi:hypothetical protein